MKQAWQIRQAEQRDAVGLQTCMELAYSPYQERMGGFRLPPMDVDYAAEIANFPTWVALSEGKVVGGLIMVFEPEIASIANIAVHPEFQGNGLGGGLMKFAENEAIERGYSRMGLATHVLLTENLSLYTHLEWQEIDRDETRVYMEKPI